MTAQTVHRPDSIEQIGEWLTGNQDRVRLQGSGSRQPQLVDAGSAVRLDLTRLDHIVRLDPGDQTCTVECGVERSQLDAALTEHALELPCIGEGTIGGLFASDPFGPAAVGGQSPRSLLLGMEAMLPNGTAFRSGARVVKSVAGFDVHKLLVGSNGRLFVANQLHLRLKPRPRAEQWFRNEQLEAEAAFRLLTELRQLATPLPVLQLRRERDGSMTVLGRVAGRGNFVASTVKRHSLQAAAPTTAFDVVIRDGEEVVRGVTLASAVPQLLELLPPDAPFSWLAGGRFETATAGADGSDALLTQLPKLAIAAAIVGGAPSRRERGTPIDTGQQQLADGLKQALDPDARLV